MSLKDKFFEVDSEVITCKEMDNVLEDETLPFSERFERARKACVVYKRQEFLPAIPMACAGAIHRSSKRPKYSYGEWLARILAAQAGIYDNLSYIRVAPDDGGWNGSVDTHKMEKLLYYVCRAAKKRVPDGTYSVHKIETEDADCLWAEDASGKVMKSFEDVDPLLDERIEGIYLVYVNLHECVRDDYGWGPIRRLIIQWAEK